MSSTKEKQLILEFDAARRDYIREEHKLRECYNLKFRYLLDEIALERSKQRKVVH